MHTETADQQTTHSLPLGIDLGTTMSAAAVVDRSGQIVTVRNEHDSGLTPSALYIGEDVYIGADAIRMDHESPGAFVDVFKRDMGEAHYHEKIRDYWVPPEVFAALILRKLADHAERQFGDLGGGDNLAGGDNLGGEIGKVVITVPAYYDERRRQATLTAGRLAGLDVADIINEPTAAALAHYYSTGADGPADQRPAGKSRMMVYDLGGGTFDVSILEADGDNFRTLATDGDVTLGGRDFDEQLVQFLAEQFLEKFGVDPRSEPQSARRLWRTAQEAKHTLSQQSRAAAVCRFAEMRLGVEVTRERFEALIAHYLQRTITTCNEVLRQANLQWSDLSDVLMVGGSSRIPAVANCLAVVSRQTPQLVASPDEVVAHGAAIYAAAQRSPFFPNLQIINVNAHSLGISGVDVETGQPVNKIVIRRNTSLPASVEKKFVTRYENQESVAVKLLEGESENPRYCTKVAECTVELQPNLPERTDILVTISYGTDGTISVSAVVPRTRESALVEITREGTAEIDPLPTWRDRLIKGEEPQRTPAAEAAPAAIVDAAPLESVIQRSDYLYRRLGEQYAIGTVPVSAVATQRALQDIRQELELVRRLLRTLELKLNKAARRQPRVRLQEDIAALRTYERHAERNHRHLLLSLGRECCASDVCPEEFRELLDELKRLDAALTAGVS